jgi:hypothetical protein
LLPGEARFFFGALASLYSQAMLVMSLQDANSGQHHRQRERSENEDLLSVCLGRLLAGSAERFDAVALHKGRDT